VADIRVAVDVYAIERGRDREGAIAGRPARCGRTAGLCSRIASRGRGVSGLRRRSRADEPRRLQVADDAAGRIHQLEIIKPFDRRRLPGQDLLDAKQALDSLLLSNRLLDRLRFTDGYG